MRRIPRLHLVTDPPILGDPAFPALAGELLEVGGPGVALHIRGHGLSGRSMWEITASCAAAARRSGAALVVNDRIDVAIACGADGVQLGQRSFAPPAARRLLGPDRWIGASIHSADEGARAREEGADFVLAGTLFESPSHPEAEGNGLQWLRAVVAVGVPVLAIGGISPHDVEAVLATGAHGAAVLSGVFGAAEPVAALRAYLGEFS